MYLWKCRPVNSVLTKMSLLSEFYRLDIKKLNSFELMCYLLVRFYLCLESIIIFIFFVYDRFIPRKYGNKNNDSHRANQLNYALPGNSLENSRDADQPNEEHSRSTNRISFIKKVKELSHMIPNNVVFDFLKLCIEYIAAAYIINHVGCQFIFRLLTRRIKTRIIDRWVFS